MSRHFLLVLVVAAVGGGNTACGDDTEPAVYVDVLLGGYEVPAQLDTLHFEISDSEGLLAERSYPLEAGEERASLTLFKGPLTRAQPLSLTVYGYLGGTIVARTGPETIVFRRSKVAELTVTLGPL